MEEVKKEKKQIENKKEENANKSNIEKNKGLMNFFKTNPKITIIGIILLIIVVVLLINGIFYSEKGRIIIEAKSTQEKVVDKNELRTVTYTYNGIAKKCKKECKNNDKDDYVYFVSYKGTVTAGIDFNKLDYKIENKKLIITVPEPIISGQNVEVGEFEYIFMDDKYNVPSELNKAFELCEKDLKSRTEKDQLILTTAKDNAITVIKQFYEPWLEKKYPEYELEVK